MPSQVTIPIPVEAELLALFDKCLESESGVAFYSCSPGRASYLRKMGEALKTETTISALKMQDDQESTLFLGSYAHIKLLADDSGIYAARVKDPALNDNQLLLVSALAGRYFTIDCQDEEGAERRLYVLRTKLSRLRKKYPEDTELEQMQIIQPHTNPTVVRIGPAAYAHGAIKEVPTDQIQNILNRMSSPDPTEDLDDF